MFEFVEAPELTAEERSTLMAAASVLLRLSNIHGDPTVFDSCDQYMVTMSEVVERLRLLAKDTDAVAAENNMRTRNRLPLVSTE